MRSTGALVALVLILLVGFAGCAGCGTYNTLVQKETTVERAWANVQSVYQRRLDLIPNLVATVQGAADFERGTLTEITELRSQAVQAQQAFQQAGSVEQQQAAAAAGESVLSRFFAIVENYPQLRANESFLSLQDQLEGTENRINVERIRYNEAVADYNASVRSFPANLFAGLFGFERKTPFEAEAGAEQAPDVQFDFN